MNKSSFFKIGSIINDFKSENNNFCCEKYTLKAYSTQEALDKENFFTKNINDENTRYRLKNDDSVVFEVRKLLLYMTSCADRNLNREIKSLNKFENDQNLNENVEQKDLKNKKSAEKVKCVNKSLDISIQPEEENNHFCKNIRIPATEKELLKSSEKYNSAKITNLLTTNYSMVKRDVVQKQIALIEENNLVETNGKVLLKIETNNDEIQNVLEFILTKVVENERLDFKKKPNNVLLKKKKTLESLVHKENAHNYAEISKNIISFKNNKFNLSLNQLNNKNLVKKTSLIDLKEPYSDLKNDKNKNESFKDIKIFDKIKESFVIIQNEQTKNTKNGKNLLTVSEKQVVKSYLKEQKNLDKSFQSKINSTQLQFNKSKTNKISKSEKICKEESHNLKTVFDERKNSDQIKIKDMTKNNLRDLYLVKAEKVDDLEDPQYNPLKNYIFKSATSEKNHTVKIKSGDATSFRTKTNLIKQKLKENEVKKSSKPEDICKEETVNFKIFKDELKNNPASKTYDDATYKSKVLSLQNTKKVDLFENYNLKSVKNEENHTVKLKIEEAAETYDNKVKITNKPVVVMVETDDESFIKIEMEPDQCNSIKSKKQLFSKAFSYNSKNDNILNFQCKENKLLAPQKLTSLHKNTKVVNKATKRKENNDVLHFSPQLKSKVKNKDYETKKFVKKYIEKDSTKIENNSCILKSSSESTKFPPSQKKKAVGKVSNEIKHHNCNNVLKNEFLTNKLNETKANINKIRINKISGLSCNLPDVNVDFKKTEKTNKISNASLRVDNKNIKSRYSSLKKGNLPESFTTSLRKKISFFLYTKLKKRAELQQDTTNNPKVIQNKTYAKKNSHQNYNLMQKLDKKMDASKLTHEENLKKVNVDNNASLSKMSVFRLNKDKVPKNSVGIEISLKSSSKNITSSSIKKMKVIEV